MRAADLQERITAAQVQVDRACELLMNPTPQSLEECSEALGEAVTGLTVCRQFVEGSCRDAAVLAPARRLQKSVGRAVYLFQTAGEHRLKWFQILRAAIGGYTPQGGAAEVSYPARVSVEG